MAYEQRDNSGTLFRNEKKEKETHPNAQGKAMIGGVMYYISAWTKEGNKGPFQSLSFTPVDQQAASSAPTKTPAKGADMDDSIPF